jgi:hypothetical protein
VKSLAKTKSCEVPHLQNHVSGTLHVVMDDGAEKDCKAGNVALVPLRPMHELSETNQQSSSTFKAWPITPSS